MGWLASLNCLATTQELVYFLSCIIHANYVKYRGACNGGVLDFDPYTLEYGIQEAYKKLKISCLAVSCRVVPL